MRQAEAEFVRFDDRKENWHRNRRSLRRSSSLRRRRSPLSSSPVTRISRHVYIRHLTAKFIPLTASIDMLIHRHTMMAIHHLDCMNDLDDLRMIVIAVHNSGRIVYRFGRTMETLRRALRITLRRHIMFLLPVWRFNIVYEAGSRFDCTFARFSRQENIFLPALARHPPFCSDTSCHLPSAGVPLAAYVTEKDKAGEPRWHKDSIVQHR